MTERDIEGPGTEVPAEDALEQRDPVADEVPEDEPPVETPVEVDADDLAEQRRTVDPGDEEYR